MKRRAILPTLTIGLATIGLAAALVQATTTVALADGGTTCCGNGSDCGGSTPWCRDAHTLGLFPSGNGGDNYCCANQTGSCMS